MFMYVCWQAQTSVAFVELKDQQLQDAKDQCAKAEKENVQAAAKIKTLELEAATARVQANNLEIKAGKVEHLEAELKKKGAACTHEHGCT